MRGSLSLISLHTHFDPLAKFTVIAGIPFKDPISQLAVIARGSLSFDHIAQCTCTHYDPLADFTVIAEILLFDPLADLPLLRRSFSVIL